jgi:hypothetical protein
MLVLHELVAKATNSAVVGSLFQVGHPDDDIASDRGSLPTYVRDLLLQELV